VRDFIETLKREARAVASAPVLSSATLFLLIVIIWIGLDWFYRALLLDKNRELAFLERRISEYRENLGGATPEELRRRLESLAAEVNTLQLRLKPRHLTADQKRAIVDRSRLPAGRAARPMTLFFAEDCSDCRRFSTELRDALSAEGNWIVAELAGAEVPELPRHGLAVRVINPVAPGADAAVLGEALRSAGLNYSIIAGAQGSQVELVVTERVAR
jgi:hypothetical protein